MRAASARAPAAPRSTPHLRCGGAIAIAVVAHRAVAATTTAAGRLRAAATATGRLGVPAAAHAAARGTTRTAVALALDGRVVRAARAAATAAATTAVPAALAAALAALGEQVLGDLGLVEVLLILGQRREAARRGARGRAQLLVPDRAERRGGLARPGAAQRVHVVERRGQVTRGRAAGRALLAGRALNALDRRGSDRLALFVLLGGLALGHALSGLAALGRDLVTTSAAPAATTAAAAPAPALAIALALAVDSVNALRRDLVELLGLLALLARRRDAGSGSARELLARQRDQLAAAGRRRDGRLLGVPRSRGRAPAARRGRNLLALAASAAAPTPAATSAGALGLLLGHLGHREVLIVVRHAAARAGGPLVDLGDLGDVGELVRDVDQVRGRVAAERDHLDPHAHLLDGADGRGEVAVARHDDRDVEVSRGLHHVDDEFDVEVGLDLAVAVLPDVLAHHLVVVAGEELVEVALVLVLGVEAGIGIRADEISSSGGRLQQRDVVDVHAGRLGRVEDVRHVHEDGDVLAQR
ncbi:MAG: hypothetical protein U0838_03100 [Chloroflexota bacterium]